MQEEILSDLFEQMQQYISLFGIYIIIRKLGKHFVITQVSGKKMMDDLHIPRKQYVGLSSKDYPNLMPLESSKRKVDMLEQVWEGDNLHAAYRGIANGVNYYSLLNPVYVNGKIDHIEGYMFYSKELLDNMEAFLKFRNMKYKYYEVAI